MCYTDKAALVAAGRAQACSGGDTNGGRERLHGHHCRETAATKGREEKELLESCLRTRGSGRRWCPSTSRIQARTLFDRRTTRTILQQSGANHLGSPRGCAQTRTLFANTGGQVVVGGPPSAMPDAVFCISTPSPRAFVFSVENVNVGATGFSGHSRH